MNNTNENNKLIAKFMELPTEIMGAKEVVYGMNHDDWYTADNLNYHLSWDWLMPVIEKIENNERYDVNIVQYGTMILDNQKEIISNIADISFDTKIEHTYDTIVKFIKYYNTIK